jgi:inner membrane protein
METQEKSFFETLNQAISKSITLKLISIFILMVMLMIPMAFIMELIQERENLRQSAITEVSGRWANDQLVYGPVLTIPFHKQVIEEGKAKTIREEAHILPSHLKADARVDPQTLHRGIYDVVVYDSNISFSGSFEDIGKYIHGIDHYEMLWEEAFLTVHISDLRGIKDEVQVNWNGNLIQVEPGTLIPYLVGSGITVSHIFGQNPGNEAHSFSFDLHLQGSRHLGFAPLGRETHLFMTSGWRDPSFSGSFLPDNRTVNEEGFSATYKILELNRNYPQSWTGNQNAGSLRSSAFGVDLLLPMNDYQKSMRSAKYALLAISLTFLTFFLVEIFNRKKIHPFQYILIGLALVLFYTLLISISEHTNFDIAYVIASASVIAMIGLYARSILQNPRQAATLVFVLILTYTFVYITLQIQDYALLIGTIGLTLILAFTMYITRNINWYELSSLKKADSSISMF